jgi:hypothetical protein
MPSLRDFWFPVLLAGLGFPTLFLSASATGNGKRVMLTITLLFFCFGILSYIWGDPVRGPFANLLRPHDAENFTIVSGGSTTLPVSQLKDGIDLSRYISIEGHPIDLWIRKTWWSGLYVKVTLKGHDGKPVLVFDNKSRQYIAKGLDVNYDGYAFEVVDSTKSPRFQLIILQDYSSLYINAQLMGEKEAIVMKDNVLSIINNEQISQPQYKLDRIFKYPSYIRQGERD